MGNALLAVIVAPLLVYLLCSDITPHEPLPAFDPVTGTVYIGQKGPNKVYKMQLAYVPFQESPPLGLSRYRLSRPGCTGPS